jgi:hypothetical protein
MPVNRRAHVRFVFALAAVTLLAWPAFALADLTKAQCIDANTSGQHLRREGKLSEAREQLRSCTDALCPSIVRDDCTRRLDELEKAQPTIAFEVKDGSGADVTAVKVTMDGKPLTDKLDGTALPVDIGQHVFTFDVAGDKPVTVSRTLLLTEGEKGRRERIAVGGPPGSALPPAPPMPSGGRLVVVVDTEATVFVDKADQGKGKFDEPLPAGKHEVLVTEPGRVPYRTEVQINDGETRRVQIVLREPPGGTQRGWGVASGIVGAAGMALSVAIGQIAKTVYDGTNAPGLCVHDVCTQDGLNKRKTVLVIGDVATGFFIGGAALLVGGIVLNLSAPSHTEPVRATVTIGAGSVAFRGSW